MAQYDDFGRPIYETAEEYNRAHRTAGSAATYESPEGDAYQHNTKATRKNQTAAQRYETRQGSKKAKSMLIGLAVFILIMILVSVYSMFAMVRGVYDDAIETYDNTWDDDDGYEEYIGDDTTPLPEGFETFTYNDVVVALPITFEEMLNMGFSVEIEYDETAYVPEGYQEFIDLLDSDGNIYAMIRVDNDTEDEIPLGKCMVEFFSISNPYVYQENVYGAPDFMFGDGLTFESTYEELVNYLGEPYYHYEDHSEEDCYYDSYEWTYYGDYEMHQINIIFWNGEIADISIQKDVDMEIY